MFLTRRWNPLAQMDRRTGPVALCGLHLVTSPRIYSLIIAASSSAFGTVESSRAVSSLAVYSIIYMCFSWKRAAAAFPHSWLLNANKCRWAPLAARRLFDSLLCLFLLEARSAPAWEAANVRSALENMEDPGCDFPTGAAVGPTNASQPTYTALSLSHK